MEIKCKYKLNTEVWFMHNNKAINGNIVKVTATVESENSQIRYKVKIGIGKYKNLGEAALFSSKENLLKSL